MIHLKTQEEIELMRQGGAISSLALKEVLAAVKPGITLAELDKIAEKTILDNGGESSFKSVDDYQYTTCINVNEGIVHGIPNNYKVKTGDLVSIDLGAFFKGFHTDLSYTIEVGTNKENQFLETGKTALKLGVAQAIMGNHIGDISEAIQKCVEEKGYSVSRDLVGHGLGRELHEDPYVPGYGKKGKGPELKEGMVLAVEVIYQKGNPAITLDKDGWTLKTLDGSLSALYECTVAITSDGPQVLTQF